MALPINIGELVSGRTVEWERIEFKAGWNPVDVLHTLCAFANDINNWGGGYIIIGLGEKNGRPVFPPAGMKPNQIDPIQKELLQVCNYLVPNYFPVVQPVLFQKKHVLVIWAPGGDNRPYKAPVKIGEKGLYAFYVRHFSNTVKAKPDEERQLLELAARIPFDDRINQHADLGDLQLTLIQSFLREVGSELLEESKGLPFTDLCRRMNIARGPDEYLKPVNVGLLFFNESPDRFFQGARIEIVEFRDEVGDKFSEKQFSGPIHQQLKDSLAYLRNAIIREEVAKVRGKEKSLRFFNYPYEAIEEALANAVYHRSYEDRNPIEISVRFDRIDILSFPGPVPPVDNALLKKPVVVARDYRNRRVGDFLKELHLTEGRATGIPKIRRSMETNGSPRPSFETDKEKTYFLATLPIHPKSRLKARTDTELVPPVLERNEIRILEFCRSPRSRKEIFSHLRLSNQTRNYSRHVAPLVKHGFLVLTLPTKPKSGRQRYRTTDKGLLALEGIV